MNPFSPPQHCEGTRSRQSFPHRLTDKFKVALLASETSPSCTRESRSVLELPRLWMYSLRICLFVAAVVVSLSHLEEIVVLNPFEECHHQSPCRAWSSKWFWFKHSCSSDQGSASLDADSWTLVWFPTLRKGMGVVLCRAAVAFFSTMPSFN